MTCRVLIVLVSLVVMNIPPARAQSPSPRAVHVIPEFGVAFPSGLFGDSFRKGGLNAGTGMNVGVSVEQMQATGFGLALGWRYFSFPIQDIDGAGVTLKGHAIDLTARGYLSNGTTRPYLMGGILVGKPKLSGAADRFPLLPGRDISGEVTLDWTFGVRFGFGVVTSVSERVGVFLAGESDLLMTDGKEATLNIEGTGTYTQDTITIQDDGSWFGIRMGLQFLFGG